jgi:LacI family transcriptional regulator
MVSRIAVAAVNFGSTFPGLMYGRIKKHLRPDQALTEVATQTSVSTELARSRLLGLLEVEPRPEVLIGVCVRPDPQTMAAFRAACVPVVLVDEEAEGATTVACDSFQGAYLAGAHLAGLGRRRIALVVGALHDGGDMNASLRLEGFKKALAEKGLAPAAVAFSRDYSRKDGATAMAGFLATPGKVDAVFSAAGDVCATGMLGVARERGVRVPEDVAVVGFDDNALAAISEPPLTTIRQPAEAMADEALRLATQETAEILAKPRRVILAPTLVRRKSA